MNSHSKKRLAMYFSSYFGRNPEWRWDYINRNVASLGRDGTNCRKAATGWIPPDDSSSVKKTYLKKIDWHP